MNVLVYSGPDTVPASLTHTLASLRTLLAPNYAVQTIEPKALPVQPWPASCALLVLPGFQSQSLSPFSAAARKGIQDYVAGGGSLLALGAGVRVSTKGRGSGGDAGGGHSTGLAFALSAQVAGLGISNGAPGAPDIVEKLTLEDSESGLSFSLVQSQAPTQEVASIRLPDGAELHGITRAGTVDISQPAKPSEVIEHLAHYVSAEAETTQVAAVQARIGRGAAAFWSARAEDPIASNPAQDKARLRALGKTLEGLGLRIPAEMNADTGEVMRPTPQILSSAPWRTGVIDSVLRGLEVPDLASGAPYTIKDSNDTFLLHPAVDAERVFAEQHGAVKTLSEDPATWNPKHIIVYKDGTTPARALTPKFTIETYYEEMEKARKERGCLETYADGVWGVGEALLYGEVVTSTQTMLDKNTHLLTALATPLLSLASAQLTGRGRGANVWLSPPGCLQFSLLLRVPLAALPAPKIVFVQYLFALAVAEACRADGVLGQDAGSRVRIKWPNDIYAIALNGKRRKIGGILVNTSFGAGKVELVVGCGLNVLNPPPIPSLAQLLQNSGGRTAPTMERTLAAIMARFERMWAEFVRERGSFEPFMDLYLDRWLHSDQQVTLTTLTPPHKVRIVGITPDHGLLRTLPERDAWAGSQGSGLEYIDLQPDGNSFDLMAGLIKTKT